MVEPKVAIVISTYNQLELLKINLQSIKSKTDYKNYRVYLVDDSGTEKIAKAIAKEFKWVITISDNKNRGFSGANNIGLKKAIKDYNPDYFLLLNDDAEIIEKNWLKRLIKIGEENPTAGILGCKIIYPDKTLQNMGGYLRGWRIELELNKNKKEIFEVDHVMGAFLLIKKAVIKNIGLLDEKYAPYLLEDTDYCLKAKEKGWKILSVPFVQVIHKKGKSIDTLEDKKRLLVRFKNDIIFSKSHLKGWNKFFRIFIYLPMVALFKKKNDTDDLKLNKFVLRKKFIRNLYLWFIAFFPRIYSKRIK